MSVLPDVCLGYTGDTADELKLLQELQLRTKVGSQLGFSGKTGTPGTNAANDNDEPGMVTGVLTSCAVQFSPSTCSSEATSSQLVRLRFEWAESARQD